MANDMARMTQRQAVLEWLKSGDTITSFDAFKELGVTRLSAIIFNLRQEGYNIESEDLKTTNRFGGKVTFSRYRLVDSPDGQMTIDGL